MIKVLSIIINLIRKCTRGINHSEIAPIVYYATMLIAINILIGIIIKYYQMK